MTEEIQVLGFVVLASTLAALGGFALYRLLKKHRRILYERGVSISQVIRNRVGALGRKLVNKNGRRMLARVTMVLALFLVLVYLVPILVSSSRSQPLYGNFDMGMKCMGGHEIFLHLEDEFAYEHCPGHRDKILIGRIIRDESSLIILNKEEEHFVRVEQEGEDLTVERLIWPKEPTILQLVGKREIKQVNNPWRTWFPRILPEH